MDAQRFITIIVFIGLSIFSLGISGCSKPLTEAEQYEKLQDSIKFKFYKTASEKAIPPLVGQVNKQAKNKKLNEIVDIKLEREFRSADAHLTLALSWTLKTGSENKIL